MHHRNTAFLLLFALTLVVATQTTSSQTSPSSGSSDEVKKLEGVTVLYLMIALALNASMQRSGADEFPCPGSLSLARTSPFVCTADILMALATLFYSYKNNLGFRGACNHYVANCRRSESEVAPLISSRTAPDLFFFVVGTVGAVKIFAAQGVDFRPMVCAAVFFSAPIIHGVMRLFADVREVRTIINDPEGKALGKDLLKVGDVTWCIAYAAQFLFWVQTAQQAAALPALSGKFAIWTNLAVSGSIIAAILISFFCSNRMYQHWSLAHWRVAEWRILGIAVFLLALPQGLPVTSDVWQRWRYHLFLPLGAFSIVVLELWVVTLLIDALDMVLRWNQAGSRYRMAEKIEPDTVIQETLAERLNPLLSTAPSFWRRTLMITFATSQLTFATVYYVLVYDATHTREAGWTSAFGG